MGDKVFKPLKEVSNFAGGIIPGVSLTEAEAQEDAARRASQQQAAGAEAARADLRRAIGSPLSSLNANRYQDLYGEPANADQLYGAVPELQMSRDQSVNAINQGVGQMVGQLQQTGDQAANQISGGYNTARDRLSPLAGMAGAYTGEQAALLGLSGNDAYQDALSRVADPLQEEQERAFRRNNAAYGGVGGNVLSALAEQTRARTEANIGQRLGLLGQASSPALQALQQMTNLDVGRGSALAQNTSNTGTGIANAYGNRGSALSNLYQNSGNSISNAYLGTGTQLAQTSQNIGNAQAGFNAFRAQQTPYSDAIGSGLNFISALSGFGA